ncbi:hypothetical protein QUB70_13110 [Microcoleus sp. A003_D6]
MPIPQEKITLVGRASCPSENLLKRIFARSILSARVKESVTIQINQRKLIPISKKNATVFLFPPLARGG